ncbi:MAG: gamma-glutamyl-gamma-aminobutyrate hydrolase family protein [Halobacteriovoraceae bacterium]|nr:gamma-glutamyl-gamma-aminobutyrate hydrolase family protein [Halobacteriovoraceae bacterium]
MKLIGITQSVVFSSSYGEKRDALDQRWATLLHHLDYTPYPVPNDIRFLPTILSLPIQGILLTGGNTLNTDTPERDQVETALLEYCLDHSLPLLGVCRGMQLILNYFGSILYRIEGHITPSHPVKLNEQTVNINSYHEYGTFEVKPPLKAIGRANDGVIEAVKHLYLPIQGIMWHPERNTPFKFVDTQLMKDIFS